MRGKNLSKFFPSSREGALSCSVNKKADEHRSSLGMRRACKPSGRPVTDWEKRFCTYNMKRINFQEKCKHCDVKGKDA